MKKLIDLESWNRKEHYLFFSKFEEPFFGVTIQIDCTKAYKKAKEQGVSFFLYYLYCSLKAANEVDSFKYRIVDGKPYEFNQVHASSTINRDDNTFGISYIDYTDNEEEFYSNAYKEIERVRNSRELLPDNSGVNIIHYSAIPWLDFSSLSHARFLSMPDSCPKISFGKIRKENKKKSMPVSIHVHHALMDGYHVGLFVDRFQELMNKS
jgi:chloramphenicol O-acetyltransferase type A